MPISLGESQPTIWIFQLTLWFCQSYSVGDSSFDLSDMQREAGSQCPLFSVSEKIRGWNADVVPNLRINKPGHSLNSWLNDFNE